MLTGRHRLRVSSLFTLQVKILQFITPLHFNMATHSAMAQGGIPVLASPTTTSAWFQPPDPSGTSDKRHATFRERPGA
jgi:hypothetical protein